ncbi:hypothetical protein D9M69_706560 [compost metagenome]
MRVFLAGLVDIFVWNFGRGAHAAITATGSDQQRALDAGAIHLLDILFRGEAAAMVIGHAHLVTEILVRRHALFGNDLGGVEIDHDVDGAVTVARRAGVELIRIGHMRLLMRLT